MSVSKFNGVSQLTEGSGSTNNIYNAIINSVGTRGYVSTVKVVQDT